MICFTKISKNINDNYLLTCMSKKLYIFDFDDTIFLRNVSKIEKKVSQIFINEILYKLKSNNKILAIASHNVGVVEKLKELGIYKLFDIIVADEYPANKAYMVDEILLRTQTKISDAIFFDDLQENISNVSKYGVHSVYIDDIYGILELI